MLDELKKNYREWKASPPGKRFQELHQRRAERGSGSKAMRIATGVVLVVTGLLLLALPGPGIPFLVVGFALFAQEFAFVARGLDRLELWFRR